MKIRFAGIMSTKDGKPHRDCPHRLELLDLQDELHGAGLPGVRQVAYGRTLGPNGERELCLWLSKVPTPGEEIPISPSRVKLAWHQWSAKHKSLDAKLVFLGLEEALANCGYEVRRCCRAGADGDRRPGRPLAMMVKFANTPVQPEWTWDNGVATPVSIPSHVTAVHAADAGDYMSMLADDEADEADSDYEPDDVDRRPLVNRQIRERRGQRKFRNALRKRYGDVCLVTGCRVIALLEAAHISPFRGMNDHHTSNGLLLRSDIHTMFDLDLLGIDPDELRVKLHPCVAKEYRDLVGSKLKCTAECRPSTEGLRTRYKRFCQRLKQLP